MTDRSLRLRRGIWIIREVTVTFENVQNILVHQGPVQRLFGISDLVVLTAGGGMVTQGEHGHTEGTGHRGIVEGISTAKAIELRERILQKLRTSPTAGLGDERVSGGTGHRLSPDTVWSPAHLAVLREIREAARALKGSPARCLGVTPPYLTIEPRAGPPA
jgi:hypothetical protein